MPAAPPAAAHVHVEPLRVRYGDTDQMGVVYYANYLRFFEVARGEWLRARGVVYKDLETEGALLPVVDAHVRYRAPARYDDLLHLACWPSHVGGASATFAYEVRRDGAVLAEGTTVHACIDAQGRVRRFPDRLRALLTYLG